MKSGQASYHFPVFPPPSQLHRVLQQRSHQHLGRPEIRRLFSRLSLAPQITCPVHGRVLTAVLDYTSTGEERFVPKEF
jgi:hypothetical protein